MQFIDRFPLPLLLVLTVFMLGAPFVPEPHLVEKMRMLAEGALTRPLDIFDVFWHLLPATLLMVKLVRHRGNSA
ncbi:MAG: RND transporter [Hydrogenophilales bacterium 28-61-23]|nr:MAG: RND transporter [Hydrogenophilales bacterium 28-61-23]